MSKTIAHGQQLQHPYRNRGPHPGILLIFSRVFGQRAAHGWRRSQR